jgi:hypothetical protein
MRSNQAAVQRRVNNARANNPQNNFSNTPPENNNNGYVSYPTPPSQYPTPAPSTSSGNVPPSMPPKLTPHQQLQFILNALGDRIAKLEMAQKNGSSVDSSHPLLSVQSPSSSSNLSKNYEQEISQIQEGMKLLKSTVDGLSQMVQELKKSPSSSSSSPDSEITETIAELSDELDTRTGILTEEINKIIDLMLHLQSDVITVFKEKIMNDKEELEDIDEENQEKNDDDVSLEYNHPDSNLISLPLDMNHSFEYNPSETKEESKEEPEKKEEVIEPSN